MPRFAANLGFLFPELPFPQRFGAAAAAGFRAVEFAQPYPHEALELAELLEANGLAMVNSTSPWGMRPPATSASPACPAARRSSARASSRRSPMPPCSATSASTASRQGPAGADPALLRATLLANLRHAAREFARAGLTLLLEPINTVDAPGFVVPRPADGAALVPQTGAANAGCSTTSTTRP